MSVLAWLLTAALVVLGVAGSVLPGLPGAPLILAAALLNRLLLPGHVSGWTLLVLALLSLLTFAADLALGALGGRAFGGTRWSWFGAPVGALLGLPLGLFGLLVGAVLGAAAFEMLGAKRAAPEALKAGLGAGLGVLAGTAGRLAIALAMAVWLVADLLYS